MTLFQNSEISNVCDDGPYYPPFRTSSFLSVVQQKHPEHHHHPFFQRTNTCFLGPKLTSFLAPTPPTRPLQPPFPNPGCELGADREPPEIERSS